MFEKFESPEPMDQDLFQHWEDAPLERGESASRFIRRVREESKKGRSSKTKSARSDAPALSAAEMKMILGEPEV
jgi:hypothetical protein